VAQFKFKQSKTSGISDWTSGTEYSTSIYALGSAPHLVGGTTFSDRAALDQTQVELLSQAAIKSMDETRKILMKWRSQGHSLTDTYLIGITESARLIGELWSRDALDFVNATIAFSRLHRVMHEFSQEFLSEGNAESNGLSLLLMTEPGSHHGLGVFMLSEFFRQAGWRVTLVTPLDIADFKRIFLSDWFDAVVLSISTDRQIDAVSKAVLELSKATINPKLKIYVGGPMVHLSPEEMNWAGALLLQTDAAETVEIVTQNAFAPSPAEVAHPIKHFDSLDNLVCVSKD
jgi:MerR family transcriptional regulator, light-induced transcriptional regulator